MSAVEDQGVPPDPDGFDRGDLSDVPAAVLRSIVDRAPTGIILTGEGGRYVFASPGAAEVMGEAPRPIPGATKHDMFDPAVAARLAAMERRLAEHGGRERVVTPALRRKLYELFDAGASINLAHAKIKARISRTMVGRTRKAWGLEHEREASARAAAETAEKSAAPAVQQLQLASAQGSRRRPHRRRERLAGHHAPLPHRPAAGEGPLHHH